MEVAARTKMTARPRGVQRVALLAVGPEKVDSIGSDGGLFTRSPPADSPQSSKPPRDRRVHAIVRDDLHVAVIDADRQISADLRAQFVFPGEVDLRTDIHNGFGGIRVRSGRG